jgi:hypothetical protein
MPSSRASINAARLIAAPTPRRRASGDVHTKYNRRHRSRRTSLRTRPPNHRSVRGSVATCRRRGPPVHLAHPRRFGKALAEPVGEHRLVLIELAVTAETRDLQTRGHVDRRHASSSAAIPGSGPPSNPPASNREPRSSGRIDGPTCRDPGTLYVRIRASGAGRRRSHQQICTLSIRRRQRRRLHVRSEIRR